MNDVAAILPLRGPVLYPGMILPVPVGRPSSLAALELHEADEFPLVFIPQLDPDEEVPTKARMAQVGCTARLLNMVHLPDGTARILVEGISRVLRTGPIAEHAGATVSTTDVFPEANDDPQQVAQLTHATAELFGQWLVLNGFNPTDHELLIDPALDPARLADQVMGNIPASLIHRIEVLEEVSIAGRLQKVVEHLIKAVAGQQVAVEVNERVQKAMDKGQREYHLKEQLKALKEELNTLQGRPGDADAFEQKVRDAKMPEEAESEALREVDRLSRLQPDSAEYTICRTWLETVCDVPWSTYTTDSTDLKRAQKVLDREHYGLDTVKERVLEYLAVRQLNPQSKGPILCFVGPPGVGKTSLGQSIADALGREFGRIALGGIKDETEIRGHRRTYIGALPGRILRALIRSGSPNPVLVLDEIDKVGNDFRGDPASALLEVLDPSQNHTFVDHYLDIPVDLSQVLFIATANVINTIPAALHDRLEVIDIPGYTEEEKTVIAKKHLIPRLIKDHGLTGKAPSFTAKVLHQIIRDYTHEAGVRDLSRQIARINRKVARQVVEGDAEKPRLNAAQIRKYLGPPRYFVEVAEQVDEPGVVVGLAWTAAGGDILFVEATRMPGKLNLRLTGSLGDVMKESAEAAMSWLRSRADRLGIDVKEFEYEFHLHVPAGGIPKDGPSAGVTMVTALASIVTGRCVKAKLAMSGEITLRGKVLPVGGVKEKVLAARRAGIRTILLPAHNKSDLEDIPPELKKDITFHFVETVNDVLELALEK
jgi:ATP-dependent Lon protease